MSHTPAIAGFLTGITVATQIPHDAGLAPIQYTGQTLLPLFRSTKSKQYVLNLTLMGPGLIYIFMKSIKV